jgi:hypothetical protein
MANRRIMIITRQEVLATATALHEAGIEVNYDNLTVAIEQTKGYRPSRTGLKAHVCSLRKEKLWNPRWIPQPDNSRSFGKIIHKMAEEGKKEKQKMGEKNVDTCDSLDEWRARTKGLI